MSKFKVGDRVKIIGESNIGTPEYIGRIGKIVDIALDTNSYLVELESHLSLWYEGDKLEGVTENGNSSGLGGEIREFNTGATRNIDTDKFDYEGFYHPIVLQRFAQYMHKHRLQADGKLRNSDNWQKGIPKDAYMKSAWRHFLDWWKQHRGLKGPELLEDTLCALLFNVQGYLFELLKKTWDLRQGSEAVE